jgi:hypothetical protein
MQDLYMGSVHDIKEGSLIEVLAIEDPHGYSFWIAKVIKIDKENEYVIAIEVKWYATGTYPFSGVYKPNMVAEKHVNRKIIRNGQNTTRHHTNLLKLEDVEILVYMTSISQRE